MSAAPFRSSPKRYTFRPPASCRAARLAWDTLAKDNAIKSMGLLDGLWMCETVLGDTDYVEAGLIRQRTERRP